ncbi:8375_t:CDS:10 [Paraglomus occultum]|uniref:8375_t:CDS:1 n=1 Tax=Paraglomus occultum TaxID=144539 RepID=A0A9N9FMD4_9GLOM|nr:8375_t:CDS:10 [Paraglomus occultum]
MYGMSFTLNIPSVLALLIVSFVIKKFVVSLYVNFHGRLSHIPGPFYSFTVIKIIYLQATGTVWKWTRTLHKKYGPIVKIGDEFLSVGDKDAIKQILVTKELPKSPLYLRFRARPDIPTLFTALDRSFHRQRRRLLSHAFGMKAISSFEPLMHSCVYDFVETIDSQLLDFLRKNGMTLNLYKMLQYVTLDIIGETAFGGSFGLVKTGYHPLPDEVNRSLRYVTLKSVIPFYGYFAKDPLYLKEFMDKLISERRNDVVPMRQDLLQLLLDAGSSEGQGLTDDQLITQVIEFMIAGSDTTGWSITIIIMLLLQNSEKKAALLEELDEALEGVPKDELPPHEILKKLPYLNAVINEAMRLWPVALATGPTKRTVEDIILCGYVIPANTQISANIYALHHSADVWGDNVEEFVPERWLDPDNLPKDAFYPFSAGSRNCIGSNFALQEMRLLVATLLHRYRLEEIPGQDLDMVQYLTPAFKSRAYNVQFYER